MEYKNCDALPESVRRRLSQKQQEAYVSVYNRAYRTAKGDDRAKSDFATRAAENIVRRMGKGDPSSSFTEDGFKLLVPIDKLDEEQQMVFGWAYVTKDEAGQDVVDHSGEVVDIAEIEKAAVDFVKESRRGGEMHRQKTAGQIVHSVVITDEVAKVLGITSRKRGWFIGYQVTDPKVWKMVKSRKYSAFSIGGTAMAEDIIDDAA